MIKTTPFHPRVAEANQTQLWSHWANYLVAEKYQMAEKFEYFAVRNAVGVFDTSPLYKYRITGTDAEKFLSGVLIRDIRKCRPGQAHYTMWCDDRGFVVEDGVIFRIAPDHFLLTAAEANLSYFSNLIGSSQVEIEEVTDDIAALSVQGPRSRQVLSAFAPEVSNLAYFHHANAKLAGAEVTISRTGFTGDLGFEIWSDSDDALAIWDAVMEEGAGHGILPFGQIALLMARIEAGLLLLHADFDSSRYSWNDEERSTPLELGMGWMLRDIAERPFIGKKAILAEMERGSRWKLSGLIVDWQAYDQMYNDAGLVPPKDHLPVTEEFMLYDDSYQRVGYATSFMYSPMVQRHIAIARVRPDYARLGTKVDLEVTINHHYERVGAEVARLPFFNPQRKTA